MYKMESYCLKCKKNTENLDPKISSTSNGKAMILSQPARDVPWTFPEGPLKVLTSKTSRELSGDS